MNTHISLNAIDEVVYFMDFITIDFEIANYNMDSACSLGMVFVKDNQIIDERQYLIQPPDMLFDEDMTRIHGITVDRVIDAENFKGVWNKIRHHFDGETFIIAHNAQFDMSVLKCCLTKYSLPGPTFNFLCSIPISTRACRGEGIPNTLRARCERFGIELIDHHDALSDARACAELVIKCVKTKKYKTIKSYVKMHTSLSLKTFSQLKPNYTFNKSGGSGRKFRSIRLSEIKSASTDFDTSHPFFEKSVVLTGDLETLGRKQALQRISDVGGIIRNSISSKTDFLIVGKQDKKIVGESGISSKERKAYDLIDKGQNIQILNESIFLHHLELLIK